MATFQTRWWGQLTNSNHKSRKWILINWLHSIWWRYLKKWAPLSMFSTLIWLNSSMKWYFVQSFSLLMISQIFVRALQTSTLNSCWHFSKKILMQSNWTWISTQQPNSVTLWMLTFHASRRLSWINNSPMQLKWLPLNWQTDFPLNKLSSSCSTWVNLHLLIL